MTFMSDKIVLIVELIYYKWEGTHFLIQLSQNLSTYMVTSH